MDKITRISAVLFMGLALAACQGGGRMPDSSTDGNTAVFGGDDGASTSGMGDGSRVAMTPEEAEIARLMQDLIVYFEFDQSDIRFEFNDMLAAHGSYLADNPMKRVRLEGHADETGGREYNIGLGERRAQAVRRILMLQGASAAQLETVSYGEERPAALGSDEEAYGLNRRVELVYE